MTRGEWSRRLARLARGVRDQPLAVQELFPYALVMLLVEQGRANVIASHPGEAGEQLTIQLAMGEEFRLVRPNVIDLRLLQDALILARQVLQANEDV